VEEISFKEGFQAGLLNQEKKKDQFFNHGSITDRDFYPVVIAFCNTTMSGLWVSRSS
jgi:hypothetical protein